ncbi:MAG: aminopeptidase [Clostridia bacterium]|nr:aminopeptidase [Clostridia bacterium]
MKDPRIKTLAKNLINYSVELQKGEKILIENVGVETELVSELVNEVYKAGAFPFVLLKEPKIERALLMNTNKKHLEMVGDFEANIMENMDAYIGIRSGDNKSELTDVPNEKKEMYSKVVGKKVHREIRVPKTKWVVLRYPNNSMAQLAGMSTEAFEDFYFKVCNLDYSKMDKAMGTLIDILNKTDRVHIKGSGTDLTFSIKGIPAVKCSGKRNIPDGEVYTAPVKNSVNGTIQYNTPSSYQGFTFENIKFTFKDGKIIEATANDSKRLNQILDIDEGARYIGEFAIGLNPYINKPMNDTLFDEKINGSFHFTPGQCYEKAPNGNKSNIHWDLVNIQRPEYGGGGNIF